MNFFEIMAECSIAAGGFAAIHAVVRGGMGPRESLRAWVTVSSSVGAFVASILPLLLALSEASPETLWRSVSLAAFLVFAAQELSVIVWDRRLDRRGHPAQAWLVLRSTQSAQGVSLALLLTNMAGLLGGPSPFLYGTAVLLQLLSGFSGLLLSFWLNLGTEADREG